MITEVKWLVHPTLWKHFRGLDLLNPASGECTWTCALKESECGRWAGSQGGKMCWRAVSILFGGGVWTFWTCFCIVPPSWPPDSYIWYDSLWCILEICVCLSLCAETIFLKLVAFGAGGLQTWYCVGFFCFTALLNWLTSFRWKVPLSRFIQVRRHL